MLIDRIACVRIHNRNLREGRAPFAPTAADRCSVTLQGEPLLLAASWDGHQVAVGYDGAEGGVKPHVEIFHVGDLRQRDGRPRASHTLPHGLRVLRWSKAGRHRLLAAGGQGLSFVWDDGRLVTRALDRALGAADWSPDQDDVVAVSYFGERTCSLCRTCCACGCLLRAHLLRRRLNSHITYLISPLPSIISPAQSTRRSR